MYEVIGFQIVLPAEQGCCVGCCRASSPKASRCSRENVKNLPNILQLHSALQTQIFVLCIRKWLRALVPLTKCEIMRSCGQLSAQSESGFLCCEGPSSNPHLLTMAPESEPVWSLSPSYGFNLPIAFLSLWHQTLSVLTLAEDSALSPSLTCHPTET